MNSAKVGKNMKIGEVAMNETRIQKVNIRKAGGNAGPNSKRYSMQIPSKWANEMKIQEDCRDIELMFKDNIITIKKLTP